MSLFALTAMVLGRAAYQWMNKHSTSSKPVTGFTYRILPVPRSEEGRFNLQNPEAVPTIVLYRDLVKYSEWADAAEKLLMKAQAMARQNPGCEIYVCDIVPTYS
jgi:hypothetical protein